MESKGTTVVASCIHQALTDSHRYTTLTDATCAGRSHHDSHRWVQKYAPELDKQTRWYRQVPDWQARSWRVDETYIRVGGTWCYL